MRTTPSTEKHTTRGQALVELVGVVFVIVLVAVLAVQGITVAQAASITQEAARSGARALSQGGDWEGAVDHQLPDGLELKEATFDRARFDDGSARVEVTVLASLGLGATELTEIEITRSAEFPSEVTPVWPPEPLPTDDPTEEAD